MQQFIVLWQKEIKSYFNSNFAYLLIYIYMMSSIGSALFFSAYLYAHDASMYSLFFLQPILMMVFLPAVTMRVWTDEFKSGTDEFLLTQPVSTWCVTVAKYSATVIFSFGMTLLLIPFIWYTGRYLYLDVLNLICAYSGLLLIIVLFCALGCFVSSFCKHVIIAYLLSAFFLGVWIVFPISGLYNSYNNFLFGAVGISDILYFLLFTIAFLILNVLQIENKRSAQKYKNFKFGIFALLLLSGVIVLTITMQYIFIGKYDMTQDRIYSLEDQTRKIIEQVKEPIVIDVFMAKDYKGHNSDYFRYSNQVSRFLKKYQDISKGMITVNFMEMEAFSENEKNALKTGIYYEENSMGTKDYFGAVIHDNNGKGIVIKQFLSERSAYLEKDINIALLRLIKPETIKSIGIYLDNEQNLEMFNGFLLNLENDYNVVRVTDETYQLSPRMDLLIMLNPKRLSPYIKYAVDQYMMNGGKTIWFIDLFTKSQPEEVNLDIWDFMDFLESWNIVLSDKLVEEGKVIAPFDTSKLPLQLFKALQFSVDNPDFEVKPVINNGDKYIGAIIKGKFPSVYRGNLYKGTAMEKQVNPFMKNSVVDTQFALIADVDIIDDENWIDESSPDRNPYSIIAKASNGEFLRNLTDYMLDNQIYLDMKPKQNSNIFSISQFISSDVYAKYAPVYKQINEEIKEKNKALQYSNIRNQDKAEELSLINASGEQIAELEKEAEKIVYLMRNEYARKIGALMWFNLGILPLFTVVIIGMVRMIRRRRQLKKIKELCYE